MRSITPNRTRARDLILMLLGALSLGCGGDGDTPAPMSDLQWFNTCGDPVCSGYNPQGTRVCDTEAQAAACATDGDTCAIVDNDCNVRLLCTDEDPLALPCPISRAAYKRDIHYVTEGERAALAQQALAIPLATYRYKTQTDARTHLGFIIEDIEPSAAVRSEADQVDLYGYSSMMLAALQSQQAELVAMRAELAALREELTALRRRKR
ncbi:MAG: hypothetical protein IPL79_11465 [Myxococcales bacterium]|nr:hypothetical protein [Myxococcales bacterium]